MGVRNAAVMFASASGSNPDIIGAFSHVAMAEPRRLAVICMRSGSPLSERAALLGWPDVLEYEPPSGKDGFLATNTLLGTAVLLVRSYAAAWSEAPPLPVRFQDFLELVPMLAKSHIREQTADLWSRNVLVVLHGPSTQAAAADIESKFTEAALGAVQVADYRNFAHGRHHWLAKQGDSTAVLALATDEDRNLADRTLTLIPQEIPRVRLDIQSCGATACVAGLLAALHVVESAGGARRLDPGRPGVPRFGSRIYQLRAFQPRARRIEGIPQDAVAAIERKSGEDIEMLVRRSELSFWTRAYRTFCKDLTSRSFRAIVLDYDGTLCDSRDRFTGVREEVTVELVRLLRHGIVLGVATGRGKSVRTDLRAVLPRESWERVLIGYYNGAEVASLADDGAPSPEEGPQAVLQILLDLLTTDPTLARLTTCEARCAQIAVIPRWPGAEQVVWERVCELVQQAGISLPVLRSSHSVDVLAPGVSKLEVVKRVEQLVGVADSAVRIGDRGAWPGNDCQLLASPAGLSVDEVSKDPRSCWNLAPIGLRGVQATLSYLRSLQCREGAFALLVGKLTGFPGSSDEG